MLDARNRKRSVFKVIAIWKLSLSVDERSVLIKLEEHWTVNLRALPKVRDRLRSTSLRPSFAAGSTAK